MRSVNVTASLDWLFCLKHAIAKRSIHFFNDLAVDFDDVALYFLLESHHILCLNMQFHSNLNWLIL
jgi:hypothetical protein